MEHREVKTPEQIAELKLRSPGGYRNLRESVINELPVLGTPTTATSGRSAEFRKGSNPNPVEFVEDLLRTPSVVDSTGVAISESQARERGRMVKVADQVAEIAFENGLQVSESIANSLLPTPRAQEPGSTSAGYGDCLNDVANRLVNGYAPKD